MPVAIKDIIDVEGLPTRANSRSRASAPPASNDAEIVLALKAQARQAGDVADLLRAAVHDPAQHHDLRVRPRAGMVGEKLVQNIRSGQAIPARQYLDERAEIDAMRDALFTALKADVFLWPAAPATAPEGSGVGLGPPQVHLAVDGARRPYRHASPPALPPTPCRSPPSCRPVPAPIAHVRRARDLAQLSM